MTPAFSLAHPTVLDLPPPEMLRVAARTGYRTVGLRLLRVTDTTPGYPLMHDPAMMRATIRVVEATGRSDMGILVDTLHFDRSGNAPADLDRLPASRLPFMHVCDTPVQDSYTTEELRHAGQAERLPPDKGGSDIKGIVRHVPPGIPLERV